MHTACNLVDSWYIICNQKTLEDMSENYIAWGERLCGGFNDCGCYVVVFYKRTFILFDYLRSLKTSAPPPDILN